MVSLILALILLLPISTPAATYYVATTGNNSNDGSESTPWLTIKKAVDTMVAGDTTYVRGGTYNVSGSIRFGVTGTASAPIKLLNYPGELPIINFTAQTDFDHVVIENNAGFANAMGWITISGFEIRNGYEGIKFYNLHDGTISHNHIHDHINQGILGSGGTRVLIQKNVVNHNGPFSTNPTSNLEHGIYIRGSHITILNNVIYDNLAYGITQNGSSSSVYSPTRNPSVEFSGANNWIIANNTIAYNRNRAGIVVWGALCDDSRYENNIFYENSVTLGTGEPQGINCSSCTGSTGLSIKNNHYYASGSGGQVGNHASLVGTISGNVVNVSPPAFVNGGNNALPVSPDFRLTASAPVNIALANEFSTNGVVGAFQPPGTPTASITTNKITVTFPISAAAPVQGISDSGVSFSCTSNVCPGSPAVSSASKVTGTDSQVEITLSGITSNACLSHADAVTVSYASATGSWTGNDNIGPYPGLHQKILSFTNLAVTNNCTGSGPTAYPGGALQILALDGNANDSSGNANNGTATGGSYVTAKVGQGFQTTNGATDRINLNYGSGVDPSATSFTIAFGVNVTTPTLNRIYGGADLGSSQRLHWGTYNGTWGLGVQTSALTTTSDLAATSGDHYIVIQVDAATDTVKICVDGTTATSGSGVKSVTSYVLASDISLGLPINFATSNTPTAVFDEVRRYSGVVSCSSLYDAWNAPAVPPGGTFTQAAIQFQGVVLDAAGSPIVVGPSVQTIEAPAGGGAVLLFQVHCENVTDCEATAFKLVYAKNGSSTFQQVPDVETADGTWMWGVTTASNLNSGVRSTRLTGSCTVTTGSTQVTSAQTPSVNLPQDGCVVLAYIVRVGSTHAGDYYDYKLRTESDVDFTTYTQVARIRVVNPMASGIGF